MPPRWSTLLSQRFQCQAESGPQASPEAAATARILAILGKARLGGEGQMGDEEAGGRAAAQEGSEGAS